MIHLFLGYYCLLKTTPLHYFNQRPAQLLKQDLRIIILGIETPGGRAFDICLLWVIIESILAVMLDGVPDIRMLAVGEMHSNDRKWRAVMQFFWLQRNTIIKLTIIFGAHRSHIFYSAGKSEIFHYTEAYSLLV